MAKKITWTNEKRRLGDLIPWERNPRQINREQAERLAESFDEFGQVETIAVSPTNDIYNGHQRLKVLMAKHGADFEVEVRVSSRALTEKEREKLTIYLHKGAAGEWDFDVLANEFELPDLIEWGFEPFEFGLLPKDDEWGDAIGALPDKDREPFQQMTFVLHDEQCELVKRALDASKGFGAFSDGLNENGNGNALARICEMFLGEHGG